MKQIPVRTIRAAANELSALSLFNIRRIEDILGGKDLVQELHRHDFYYVLAVDKGKGVHEIDFNPYKIRDRSVFFMRPGQVHQLVIKKGSRGYLLEFKHAFYREREQGHPLLRSASGESMSVFSLHRFQKILYTLNAILEEYTAKETGFMQAIQAHLDNFFIALARNPSGAKLSDGINSKHSQQQFDKLTQLIESNIASHKSVAQYADMLNLSVYQLNAITRSTVGKTTSELIDEYIILEAKRYLLATTSQISQIAFHLGYDDASYFSRFFRKHTGHTPEAFRNNFT